MKPILFNTDMVRAILDGRKTVTRRVIRGGKTSWNFQGLERDPAVFHVRADGEACPKTVKGLYATFEADPGVWFPMFKAPYESEDILYVRETWYYEWHMHDRTYGEPDLPGGRYSHRYIFKADQPNYPVDIGVGPHGWMPSIHMPREAARIFLRVTDVRVERLKDIDDEQAKAEGANFGIGIDEKMRRSAIDRFAEIWDSAIKPKGRDKYGWDANPWVWVIEFERISKEDIKI